MKLVRSWPNSWLGVVAMVNSAYQRDDISLTTDDKSIDYLSRLRCWPCLSWSDLERAPRPDEYSTQCCLPSPSSFHVLFFSPHGLMFVFTPHINVERSASHVRQLNGATFHRRAREILQIKMTPNLNSETLSLLNSKRIRDEESRSGKQHGRHR